MISDILPLKIGDILTVTRNNFTGFKTGYHRRLKTTGTYPYYKTQEKMNIVKYPTYPEVPLHVDD